MAHMQPIKDPVRLDLLGKGLEKPLMKLHVLRQERRRRTKHFSDFGWDDEFCGGWGVGHVVVFKTCNCYQLCDEGGGAVAHDLVLDAIWPEGRAGALSSSEASARK